MRYEMQTIWLRILKSKDRNPFQKQPLEIVASNTNIHTYVCAAGVRRRPRANTSIRKRGDTLLNASSGLNFSHDLRAPPPPLYPAGRSRFATAFLYTTLLWIACISPSHARTAHAQVARNPDYGPHVSCQTLSSSSCCRQYRRG